MANLARVPSRKVSEYANSFLGSGNSECAYCFGVSLDMFLRNHYRYRPEQDEMVRTPDFMLSDYETLGYCEGDCDDVATLICALSRAAGFSSRLVAIAGVHENPGKDLDHVFSEVLCDGDHGKQWQIIDPTVERGTVYQCYKLIYEPV